MQREERERMLRMVTWLTQLEWQMDWPLLMEWRRLKSDWYRETRRRNKCARAANPGRLASAPEGGGVPFCGVVR